MTKYFKPEFKQEVAEFVVDKDYLVRESTETMGVGNLPSINGRATSAESVTEKILRYAGIRRVSANQGVGM
jgi:hypothetical protein